MSQPLLLDDYGMLLKRHMFDAYQDMLSSMVACPGWRSFAYVRNEFETDVYRMDFTARRDECILRTQEFLEHFHFLASQKCDIAVTRRLQWHLVIDSRGCDKIESVFKRLAEWHTVIELVGIMSSVVEALEDCKHRRNTKSVRG
jgi:hypothetical protein